ncbi:MAG TPA: PEP-CTERM sorting domain-containing protein [Aquabacterium sp.]|uniref:PEP-CTERM sorting domain-containing protein n=1 Tax=Aquabacterium sp. TaxID=1872578 RepID=UPI002E32A328|nr:PEP-CTERM sorting domain-containing protein [Aquabacterium sp.]HEX5371748.1 PEP-CTERM sorting domain-containing protein [Aquabacterium sp.]
MIARSLIAMSIALASVGAQAATTVFEDNFDANALSISNPTPIGWTVSNGSVDVIGQPAFYDLEPGNGRYIDLDGSSSNAGELTKSLAFNAGWLYTATFSLAGSNRSSTEIVDVTFGTTTATYTLLATDPFATYSLTFAPAASGVFNLTFANRGGDNIGALLDNVKVTAVPEPGSLALVLAGLGVVGFAARRRF